MNARPNQIVLELYPGAALWPFFLAASNPSVGDTLDARLKFAQSDYDINKHPKSPKDIAAIMQLFSHAATGIITRSKINQYPNLWKLHLKHPDFETYLKSPIGFEVTRPRADNPAYFQNLIDSLTRDVSPAQPAGTQLIMCYNKETDNPEVSCSYQGRTYVCLSDQIVPTLEAR